MRFKHPNRTKGLNLLRLTHLRCLYKWIKWLCCKPKIWQRWHLLLQFPIWTRIPQLQNVIEVSWTSLTKYTNESWIRLLLKIGMWWINLINQQEIIETAQSMEDMKVKHSKNNIHQVNQITEQSSKKSNSFNLDLKLWILEILVNFNHLIPMMIKKLTSIHPNMMIIMTI